MRKKSILALLLVLVFVLAAGCGNTSEETSEVENNNTAEKQTTTNEPVDLVLKDSFYNIQDGYVHYIVSIENPNEGYMPEFVNIKVTGKKADGSIDFSTDWVVSALAPGSTTYWASQAGDGNSTDEDTVEISLSVDDGNWVKSGPKPSDLYVFDNVSVSPVDFGAQATGEITLTDASVDYGVNGITKPMIVCALKDADGNLCGGFNGYVNSDLQEGAATVFDIRSFHEIGDYETAEMYANPWM